MSAFGFFALCTLMIFLGGCKGYSLITTARDSDVALTKGPPIRDVVTPFDKALRCLRHRVNKNVTFSVGAVLDQTGKEQLTDGGLGKFVTQGAGDMLQSALYASGVSLLNRRDPRIIEAELKWRLHDQQFLISSDYYITGSINSLDIMPGGGVQVEVAGIGPTYSQMRMLIGIDLAMTRTKTSQIIANVALQKQIFATDFNFAMGNFLGTTLLNVNTGYREREAIHFALRQMINLAAFELLIQIMHPQAYADCASFIDRISDGSIENTKTAGLIQTYTTSANNILDEPGAGSARIQSPGIPNDVAHRSIGSLNDRDIPQSELGSAKDLLPSEERDVEIFQKKQEVLQFAK